MCRLGFKAAVEYTKETEHVIEKHVCALSYGYSSHYYLCINYLSVTHACSETKSAPLSPLSQDSPWWAGTVQSLQTLCQQAPHAGVQAAWRQSPEALVHNASHSRAARRLDHWAAGTGLWGWLLPWGNASRRMTQRQTGRDDAMSRISNSLTGTASNSKSHTQS